MFISGYKQDELLLRGIADCGLPRSTGSALVAIWNPGTKRLNSSYLQVSFSRVLIVRTRVFQEQDPDLRALWGNRPGCLPLLLPRHGRGPQNVSSQVSETQKPSQLSVPWGPGSVSHGLFSCVCFPGPTGGSAPYLTPCSSLSMMKSVSWSSDAAQEVSTESATLLSFLLLVLLHIWSNNLSSSSVSSPNCPIYAGSCL